MKRIFIFGTGNGAINYLELKLKGDYEILGFIDNDESKQGSLFQDKMIFGPEILKKTEYDEIHLASMWARIIKKQLLQDYAVPEERIKEVSKHDLKIKDLFASEQIQHLAKQLINDICAFCEAINTPIYLTDGSLLGIIRNKALIAWDDDIDFVIQEIHRNAFEIQLPYFLSQTPIKEYFDFKISSIDRVITLFLEPKQNIDLHAPIPVSFTVAYMQEDCALIQDGSYFIPKHFFSSLQWIDLYPGKASTFHEPEKYLTLLYGDWTKIRKDFEVIEYGNFIA